MLYESSLCSSLTEVDQSPKQEAKWDRDDHGRVSSFSVVHHEKRDGSNDGYGELMPPTDVKHVVQKAEKRGNHQGQQRGEIDGQLKNPTRPSKRLSYENRY